MLLNNPPDPAYPEYPAIVAEARRITPTFVDPANLHPERPVVDRRGLDWCTAVLGRPIGFGRRLTVHEQYVLIAADAADVDPPLPAWIAEAREDGRRRNAKREAVRQAHRRRDEERWRTALEQATVALEVCPSSRPRVRAGHSGHLGHAVPIRDVYSGTRTVRVHPAGRALCESERRARPLDLGSATAADPVTCLRCLNWAPNVRGER